MHDVNGAGRPEADPVRVRLLNKGAEITAGDRNRSYGDPVYQLGVAGEFKRMARDCAVRSLTDAEWEALDMIFTKISRAIVGGDPGLDTFVDMATYAAIFGECYARRDEDGEPIEFADEFDGALAAHKENY